MAKPCLQVTMLLNLKRNLMLGECFLWRCNQFEGEKTVKLTIDFLTIATGNIKSASAFFGGSLFCAVLGAISGWFCQFRESRK